MTTAIPTTKTIQCIKCDTLKLYWDVHGNGTDDGTRVILWSFHGEANQHFVHDITDVVDSLGYFAASGVFYCVASKKFISCDPHGHLVLCTNRSDAEPFVLEENGQIRSANTLLYVACNEKQELVMQPTSFLHFSYKNAPQPFQFKNMIHIGDDYVQEGGKMDGANEAIKLVSPTNPIVWFFKRIKDNRALAEIAASSCLNYLTKGLVLKSTAARYKNATGIAQVYIKMDQTLFQKLTLVDEHVAGRKYMTNFENFSQEHMNQFLIHLLADRIVSNWDSHNRNYGVDCETQRVISFDKELSFANWSFEHANKETFHEMSLDSVMWNRLSFNFNHGYHMINASFAWLLRRNLLYADWNDEELQQFFVRCEQATLQQVQDWFGDMAVYFYKEKSDMFLTMVHERMNSMRGYAYQYFFSE